MLLPDSCAIQFQFIQFYLLSRVKKEHKSGSEAKDIQGEKMLKLNSDYAVFCLYLHFKFDFF